MINKVTLIGNTGQQPDVRTLDNGTQVAKFSLATNENYKDKDGNWQKQTEWHSVIAWRDLAERIVSMQKGTLVYVEGKITYRKYTDKDGVERNVTDIVASVVRTLEKKEATQDAQHPATAHGIPEAQPRTAGQHAASRTTTFDAPPSNTDDLPF